MVVMITMMKNYVRIYVVKNLLKLIDFVLDRIHFHTTELFEHEYFDVNSEMFIKLSDELCESLETIFFTSISSKSQFPCSLIYVR